MQKEPPPFIWAAPDEKNILTCKPPSPMMRFCSQLSVWIAGNYIIVCRQTCQSCNYLMLKHRSEDLQTPPLLAESIMASSCSHRSIHLNLLALRCALSMTHEGANT